MSKTKNSTVRKGKYFKSRSPRSVSIFFQSEANFVDRATASVTRTSDGWWVDRVFVYPTLRGKGLGKKLLLDVIERASKLGCTKFIVAPGGYNMKYSDQKAFYESCGFTQVKSGVMELKKEDTQ